MKKLLICVALMLALVMTAVACTGAGDEGGETSGAVAGTSADPTTDAPGGDDTDAPDNATTPSDPGAETNPSDPGAETNPSNPGAETNPSDPGNSDDPTPEPPVVDDDPTVPTTVLGAAEPYVFWEEGCSMTWNKTSFGHKFTVAEGFKVTKIETGEILGAADDYVIKVYEWKGNYADTVAAEARYTAPFNNGADNASWTVEITDVELTGKLYWELTKADGSATVTYFVSEHTESKGLGATFIDGTHIPNDAKATITLEAIGGNSNPDVPDDPDVPTVPTPNYDEAVVIDVATPVAGEPGATAKAYVTFNGGYLFIRVDVTDPTYTAYTEGYIENGDGIELRVDLLHDTENAYFTQGWGADGAAYRGSLMVEAGFKTGAGTTAAVGGAGNEAYFEWWSNHMKDNGGATVTSTATETGYTVEYVLKADYTEVGEYVPHDGQTIGVGIRVFDNGAVVAMNADQTDLNTPSKLAGITLGDVNEPEPPVVEDSAPTTAITEAGVYNTFDNSNGDKGHCWNKTSYGQKMTLTGTKLTQMWIGSIALMDGAVPKLSVYEWKGNYADTVAAGTIYTTTQYTDDDGIVFTIPADVTLTGDLYCELTIDGAGSMAVVTDDDQVPQFAAFVEGELNGKRHDDGIVYSLKGSITVEAIATEPEPTPTIDLGAWADTIPTTLTADQFVSWVADVPANFTMDVAFKTDGENLYVLVMVADEALIVDNNPDKYDGDVIQLAINAGAKQIWHSFDYTEGASSIFDDGQGEVITQMGRLGGWMAEVKIPISSLGENIVFDAEHPLVMNVLLANLDRDNAAGAAEGAWGTFVNGTVDWSNPNNGALTVTVNADGTSSVEIAGSASSDDNGLKVGENEVKVTVSGYYAKETVVTFTATEAGAYTINTAEGETNASVVVEFAPGNSEMIELPYEFKLEAGASITFIVFASDVMANGGEYEDVINLVIAVAGGSSEPVVDTAPTTAITAANEKLASFEGEDKGFNTTAVTFGQKMVLEGTKLTYINLDSAHFTKYDGEGVAEIKIYKWLGSVEASKAAGAIYTGTQTDDGNNQYVINFVIDETKATETITGAIYYEFTAISEGEALAVVWDDSVIPEFAAFLDGKPIVGGLKAYHTIVAID